MTVHAFPNPSAAEHPSAAPLARQFFPDDAQAIIYRPERSVMTSGKANTGEWKLRFERRTSPFIEPLMGWTGGDDTLSQVELSFPTAESAIAYARRQGLPYVVQGAPVRRPELRVVAGSDTESTPGAARRRRLEWVENTLGCDAIRDGLGAGADPAARYSDPQAILRDETLTVQKKRDMLQRWALDAYLLEVGASQGTAQSKASRLEEVIDAIIDLDGAAVLNARNSEHSEGPRRAA